MRVVVIATLLSGLHWPMLMCTLVLGSQSEVQLTLGPSPYLTPIPTQIITLIVCARQRIRCSST